MLGQVAAVLKSDDEMYYYRTQDGAEIDLLIRRNNRWLAAAEIKFSSAPSLSKGTHIAMEDLGIEKLSVITPESDTYPPRKKHQGNQPYPVSLRRSASEVGALRANENAWTLMK